MTGKEVKVRLDSLSLSQKWLIAMLKEHGGIITDKTELSSVLSNRRTGLKASAIIEQSMMLMDRYEGKM